jgi:hypothetical protein
LVRAIDEGWRSPEWPSLRSQEKILITRFRSYDAAWSAAERLSLLVPGHDYKAWPARGYWALVTRYRDDDGHIRFRFVGSEDRLSKKQKADKNNRAISKRCSNEAM